MNDMNSVLKRLVAIEDELIRLRKQRNYELNNLDETNIPQLKDDEIQISQNKEGVGNLSEYTGLDKVVHTEEDDKENWDTTQVYHNTQNNIYFYFNGKEWAETNSPVTAPLESSVKVVTESVTRLETEVDDKVLEINKNIASVETKTNANSASITTLTKSVNQTSSKVSSIEQKSDENSASILSLTQTVNKNASNITSIEQKSNENSASIVSLTRTVTQNTENITSVTQTTNENSASIVSLTQTVNENASNIASVTQTTNDNSASITSLTQSVTANTTNIALVKQTADTNQSNITSLTKSVDENTTNIATVTQTADKNKASISTLTASVDKNTANIASVTQTADSNKSSITSLTSTVSSHSSSIASITQSVNSASSNITLLSQYTGMKDVVTVTGTSGMSSWDTSKIYYVSNVKRYAVYSGGNWIYTSEPILAGSSTVAAIRTAADEAEASVSTIVTNIGSNGTVNAASIVAKINAAGSSVQIAADHISLKGKTIALTSDSINIESTYFDVSTAGVVSCSAIEITGDDSYIEIDGSTVDSAKIKVNYTGYPELYIEMSPGGFSARDYSDYGSIGADYLGIGNDYGFVHATGNTFGVHCDDTGTDVLYVYASPDSWSSSNQVTVNGSFVVSGYKSRVESTEHYGNRLMYAYETPAPMYADFGRGTIAEDGMCVVYLDPLFYECVDNVYEYFVFLQRESGGEIEVAERLPDRFTVTGAPGATFAWMLTAPQKGFVMTRCEEFFEPETEPPQIPNPENAVYDKIGDTILKDYENQLC